MAPFRPLLPLTLLAGCAAPPERAAPLERFEFEQPHMGTSFRIVLYAPDAEGAGEAAAAAFARVAELDRALSDYDPGSELSRLSRASDGGPSGPRPVSPDLFRVLDHARRISAASGGAFDVTVGPYVRLWRRSARQGRLPSAEELARARGAVGWEGLDLDPGEHTVALGTGGMRLDLGGIAKGYALDQALAVLAARGVGRALVDGGGDVAASGPPPGRAGWRVVVAALGRPGSDAPVLELAHRALATSGDRYRRLEIDGVTYSHLIDPRTGLGLTEPAAASVVSRSGMAADALASALCVMGPEAGLALVEISDETEARFVGYSEKAGERSCQSSGWGRMIPR